MARRRLTASHEYGGLQIFFTEQITDGLLLNMFKRIRMQIEGHEEDRLEITNLMSRNFSQILT